MFLGRGTFRFFAMEYFFFLIFAVRRVSLPPVLEVFVPLTEIPKTRSPDFLFLIFYGSVRRHSFSDVFSANVILSLWLMGIMDVGWTFFSFRIFPSFVRAPLFPGNADMKFDCTHLKIQRPSYGC